jgi:hypothetical protein
MSLIIINELLKEKMKRPEYQNKHYIVALQKCLDKNLRFSDFLTLGRWNATGDGILFPGGYIFYRLTADDFLLFHPDNNPARVTNTSQREALEFFWDNFLSETYNTKLNGKTKH